MLTEKQKKFCDFYIETGNATESARRAGYKHPNKQGPDNLVKLGISEYIKERVKQIEDARIADVKEVLQFYTSVLRGEVPDQFGLEADLATRMSAGKELMKRHERIEDIAEKRKEKYTEKKKRITVVVNRGELDD